MNMMIGKKYCAELELFYKYRDVQDGIDWFTFGCISDWYDDDHKPSFGIHIGICNIMIVEFNIFNINHRD